jgi:hypothetical protein
MPIHLDQLHHQPNTDWQPRPDEEFIARHDEARFWAQAGSWMGTIPAVCLSASHGQRASSYLTPITTRENRVIHPSRGKAVVQSLFSDIKPLVWVSDVLHIQRDHAVKWQACLAHLLRTANYAIDCGDTACSQYLADLERRLDRIMAMAPIGEPGAKVRRCLAAHREHQFAFTTYRDVPPTNNISERSMRPSVISQALRDALMGAPITPN